MPEAKCARMRDGVSSVGAAMPRSSPTTSNQGEGGNKREEEGERGKRTDRARREKKNRGKLRPGTQIDGDQHEGKGVERHGKSANDGDEQAGGGDGNQAYDEGNGERPGHGKTSAATAHHERTCTPSTPPRTPGAEGVERGGKGR